MEDLSEPIDTASEVYQPEPIDTESVSLPEPLVPLTELLAKNAHDNWALKRFQEGWTYGPHRDDTLRKHPGLVPYERLSESEKEYDRAVATGTLKAVIALGYRIVAPEKPRRNRR